MPKEKQESIELEYRMLVALLKQARADVKRLEKKVNEVGTKLIASSFSGEEKQDAIPMLPDSFFSISDEGEKQEAAPKEEDPPWAAN